MSDSTWAVRKWGLGSLNALKLGLLAQWPLLVIPACFLATNAVLFRSTVELGGDSAFDVFANLVDWSIPEGLFVLFIVRLVQFAFFIKPESPTKALLQDLRNIATRPAWLINGIPVIIAMVLFNKAVFDMKPMIPVLHPFDWDQSLAALDRAIHFGVDPWRILQPIMGYPIVTFLTNLAYDFWFVALFGSWVWFCFQSSSTELRTRFFLAYMLIWWVGGGILAVIFSSAGPCYYGKIGLSPDPFADLMTYLHGVNAQLPIWALDAQDLLWDGYTGKTVPLGISAFPSMHNGNAVLFALAVMQVNKGLGRFFMGYAALILVTSVHLGWHYAVDGYAAIALALGAWWLCGHIARWLHSRPVMASYNRELSALSS